MLQQILPLTLVILILAYLGLCAYAYVVADKRIFPEIPASYSDGPHIIKLDTTDGERISAYFLEAPESKTVLLYCHGNGEDLGHIRASMEAFQRMGLSVLAYNYPGYGTSTGKATERGCYAASDAAYAYVTGTLGFDPAQVCVYGRSLGGGPACWLAQRYPVGSMILDSTFTSTFRVMTRHKLLPWDKFDNIAKLKDIRCPILFIHGTQDQTVPFSHGQRNFETYKGTKMSFWIEDAGHSDLYEIAGDSYPDTVLQFIDSHHERHKQ